MCPCRVTYWNNFPVEFSCMHLNMQINDFFFFLAGKKKHSLRKCWLGKVCRLCCQKCGWQRFGWGKGTDKNLPVVFVLDWRRLIVSQTVKFYHFGVFFFLGGGFARWVPLKFGHFSYSYIKGFYKKECMWFFLCCHGQKASSGKHMMTLTVKAHSILDMSDTVCHV